MVTKKLRLIGSNAPTPGKVNWRLKCFVTLVTYCYYYYYYSLQCPTGEAHVML
jgi:hypothetical protein